MQAPCKVQTLLPLGFEEEIWDKDEFEGSKGIWNIDQFVSQVRKDVEDVPLIELVVLSEHLKLLLVQEECMGVLYLVQVWELMDLRELSNQETQFESWCPFVILKLIVIERPGVL